LTAPPVRILRVPSIVTFHQLHLIIQAAFDYTDSHLYRFKVRALRLPGERKPVCPVDPMEIMTLDDSLLDPHHEDFMRAEELERMKKSREVKLWQVYESTEWRARGVVMDYQYDFGSPKHFDIQLMGQADPMIGKAIGKRVDQDVSCLAGEGRAIDEDDDCAPRTGPWKWSITQVNKDLKKLMRLKVYTK